MTDNELQFFDPETGKLLHRVPEGATIPENTPYGIVEHDKRWWYPEGQPWSWLQEDYVHRFTREPIAPPTPLPTEPGATIRAVHQSGGECAVMVRGMSGYWHGVDQYGDERSWDDRYIASWEPVTAVPTETWDRLRVLDPEDKRDRVDANGVTWISAGGGWLPDAKSATLRCYMSLENIPGPLRFADEVSDR